MWSIVSGSARRRLGGAGQVGCGAGVVAGQHRRAHPHRRQAGDDLGRLGAQFVPDAQRTQQLPVVLDQDDGRTGVLVDANLLLERPRVDEAGPAQPGGPPVDQTGEALADQRLHVDGLRRRSTALLG